MEINFISVATYGEVNALSFFRLRADRQGGHVKRLFIRFGMPALSIVLGAFWWSTITSHEISLYSFLISFELYIATLLIIKGPGKLFAAVLCRRQS